MGLMRDRDKRSAGRRVTAEGEADAGADTGGALGHRPTPSRARHSWCE